LLVIGQSNHGASCSPLNVFDLSSYALEIKDIATGKMMLLRRTLFANLLSPPTTSGSSLDHARVQRGTV
jgi:hypothetical protein